MKHRYITLLTLACISTAGAAFASPLDFPKYGFKIDALDTPPGPTPAQAIMMFLPAKDGFAPNVNVVIQPYPGTMKEYIALTKGQFVQMKWKIISEKSLSETEWICEYSGDMQQAPLHWYARAALKAGKVYLTTGTAKGADWESSGPALKKCVDSFMLE